METTVKERLMEFIEYKNIKKRAFEEAVGLSNGYLNQLRNSPGVDKISAILETYPEINKVWLLTGEGEMLKTSPGGVPAMPPPGGEAAHVVPLLPLSAQGGPLNDFVLSVREAD